MNQTLEDNRMNLDNSYLLSSLQQGMLFHFLTDPTSGTDIDQISCHLKEKIDQDKLQQAWDEIFTNHEVCRTNFIWEDVDQPIQNLNENVTAPISFYEAKDLPGNDVQSKLKLFLDKDRAKGFNLNKAPLIRISLIKFQEADYYLIWTFHHIIMDGRSHAIILNNVFNLYDSHCDGNTVELKKTLPYRSFIEWMTKQDHKKSESFWRKFLQGFTSPTILKSNHNKPDKSVQINNKEKELEVDENTSVIIQEAAKKNGVTLNTLVQGAWGFLLSKHSGENDVVFGAVRAGRYSTVEDAESIAGLFMNTLPMRIQINYEKNVADWLKDIRDRQIEVREYEHTPLVDVNGWSELPRGSHLFQSVLVFDNYDLTIKFQEKGGKWLNREFKLLEKTGYPITVYVYADKRIKIKIAYDPALFHDDDIEIMLNHFNNILEGLTQFQEGKVYQIPILTGEEINTIFEKWNNTKTDYPTDKCIHQLFEEQAEKTPGATAVICKGESITYFELNNRANQLARKLQKAGVKPETLVGISLHRSVNMMIAILGTLKAGGAYVPLDPDFPKERVYYMIQDSNCPVVITEVSLKKALGSISAKIISLDSDWKDIEKESIDNFNSGTASENLAYVIYTSGSTGKPKGVMVEHKNVVNFFTGMDECINYSAGKTWLAVTSLSFDISVLELLWTLCRGFNVIIHAEEDWKSEKTRSLPVIKNKKIEFSLFYFSSYASENDNDKYRLLLEGAKFADQNRFSAVWTPERHFHDFGGLYPNPAVTSAAIAAITNNIRIMSGSVVSPLHSPIRIAEDWSVVDNLSNGRIGISFASGWQPNDFAIMPGNYERRKDIMFEQIEIVRKLWKGESVEFDSPNGKKILIKTLPKPVQKELPIWITAASNPETFQMAGERGFNILTHLLGQSIDDLEEKINVYRNAWRENGHGPGGGHVSLMLHTFVGENLQEVKETVREPMKQYLKSAMSLVQMASWYFPVYNQGNADIAEAAANLSEEDKNAILNHSFERYFETSALLGTPETCLETIKKIKRVGVDEVACLVDFGVASEKVLSHLQYLNAVKTLANLGVEESKIVEEKTSYSIPDLLNGHKVTHMQCTPSMARMLLLDSGSKHALKNLEYLLIGGEAFPVSLSKELREVFRGKLLNMYGPTETTIWSTIYAVDNEMETIPIGKPIANTEIFIMDKYQQMVPIGTPGELCIGGEGVVRGYFQRPELTSEKFIHYTFNGYNKKIYRTGDLARYNSDGLIEFIGRLDHQVKIRGYRIELGEIETILEKHPQVREAAVIAREDLPGDKKLVAYVVSEKSVKPSTTDLRKYLMEILPEYMLPSVFVFMQNLPTTPNGKVDRKALPAPEDERPDLGKEFISPKSNTEKQIAQLWSQVLGIGNIGLQDNFFDLGGHSLSAVQAVVKIHQTFHIDLSLQSFFQAGHLKELAAIIDEKILELADKNHMQQLLHEIENSK